MNINPLIPLIFALVLVGCQRAPSNFENGDPSELTAMNNTSAVESKRAIPRKLIKQGSIEFETEDLIKTRKFISEIAIKYEAYVSDETSQRFDEKNQLTITLRIPADKFDDVTSEIENHALRIESKNVNVKDVTEEFIDVEARLKTKKELEIRYLALLKQAKNVQEIISVESQLVNVRSDIESMEGRLKYLQDQVNLSTLHVECFETTGPVFSFASGIFTALSNGWNNLLKFVIGLLNVWPFLIIAGGILYLVFKLRRKKHLSVETKSPL